MATLVFSLVGSSHFDCSLLCLDSFIRHSVDNCELHVVSDGTLQNEHLARLERQFSCRIHRSEEFGSTLAREMANYPLLRANYQENVFFKKLVDIPFFAEKRPFRYIDSDIFFWKDFHGLFDADPITTHVVAEDLGVSFGIRDLWRFPNPVVAKTNAGILQGTPVPFDEIEGMLEMFQDTRSVFREQAIYSAAWASRAVESVPRSHIEMPGRGVGLPKDLTQPKLVGLHLAGDRKHLVGELRGRMVPTTSSFPVRITRRRQIPSFAVRSIFTKLWSRLVRPA